MKFHALALIAAPLALAAPTPPGLPSASAARSALNGLRVAERGSLDGYSRAKFPHWIAQAGACDTRETVLQRDGASVRTGAGCAATSGTWVSPYDGATWTAASDVDVDHMVPLANAWVSGAASWTTDRRTDFANDLDHPQLWTVTDNVNQSKGDRAPDEWQPPLESFYCEYARAFVKVKSIYDLAVTSDEKSALLDMIGTC